MFRSLRHRDFGLLWAGMSVSLIGDGFYQVALAWQVYLLSDAPTALSIVGAAVTLPHVLFVLFAGVLTDRFERRRVLVVADAMRAGAVVAAAFTLLCFMGPMRVLVPFVVKNQLNGSASDLGLVFATGGVGAILASLAFSQRGQPRHTVVVMFVAWGLATYALAGFGLAGALWQVAIVSFVSSGLATIGQLIWMTLLSTRVPRELLGRVSSLDWMLSIGLVPLSFVATGPVAELIGVDQTLIAAGALGGSVFLSLLLLPGMRDLGRVLQAGEER